jgi:hypothetical protein
MALSNQSQLDMLADRFEQAIDGGARAMRLAEALGRWDIYLHAWTNVASARSSIDAERGYAELLDAVRVADERGLPDYVPRLYVNLCYNKTHERHYDRLFEHLDDGIARCVERDNAPLEAYLQGVRAAALLDRGRLHEAAEEAERVVVRTSLAAIPRFSGRAGAEPRACPARPAGRCGAARRGAHAHGRGARAPALHADRGRGRRSVLAR